MRDGLGAAGGLGNRGDAHAPYDWASIANSSRRRMFRLVKAQLGAAGEFERAQQAPPLVGDLAVLPELGQCRADVVAHQIQLVLLRSGMQGELGGRERED